MLGASEFGAKLVTIGLIVEENFSARKNFLTTSDCRDASGHVDDYLLR
jgi:hypothetical protein